MIRTGEIRERDTSCSARLRVLQGRLALGTKPKISSLGNYSPPVPHAALCRPAPAQAWPIVCVIETADFERRIADLQRQLGVDFDRRVAKIEKKLAADFERRVAEFEKQAGDGEGSGRGRET